MKILFLCVANSARSQMAEGIARNELDNQTAVFSAGSQPKTLNSLAIEVMQEIGIDISHQYAKSIDSIDLTRIDIIITLCAEEVCPLVLGDQQKYHWPLPDPANQSLGVPEQLELFRNVRDELKKRIVEFKQILEKEQKNDENYSQ